MIYAILVLALIVSLIGWLSQYIGNATLLWYLTQKNFPLPSEEEMKRGSRWVASHMVKDLTGRHRRH